MNLFGMNYNPTQIIQNASMNINPIRRSKIITLTVYWAINTQANQSNEAITEYSLKNIKNFIFMNLVE